MVWCTGLFVLFVLTGCEGWFGVQDCLFCLFQLDVKDGSVYRIVCFVVFTGCEGWFGVQDCLFCLFLLVVKDGSVYRIVCFV